MIVSFIITFRETLEAALIVGIIIGYLNKINQSKSFKFVIWGILSGIIVSIFGALLFNLINGGFVGKAEQIYEGIVMILGSFLITTMILWMISKKNISQDIIEKIDLNVSKSQNWGLFFLVFISIVREGIETILFLGAINTRNEDNALLGAILGILLAIVIGLVIFTTSKRVPINKFFNYTSVFLIFVAGGLLAYGLHELQEASVIPIIVEHLYDINFILDEQSLFGDFLKGIFSYNSNPSLLEFIGYLLYIIGSFSIWYKILKSRRNLTKKLEKIDEKETINN